MIERRATVVWEGGLRTGQGILTADTSQVIVAMPLSWAARTDERNDESPGRTTPEELLAAAHASSYAMSLADVLDERGVGAERLEVVGSCRLESSRGGFRLAEVHVHAAVQAPGLDPGELERLARVAEDRCPVSNALRGEIPVQLETEVTAEAGPPVVTQPASGPRG